MNKISEHTRSDDIADKLEKKGFTNGLIKEIASLAAKIIGLYAGGM